MIAVALAVLLPTPADLAPDLCRRALAAVPAYAACAPSGAGVALAMDQVGADTLAGHASAGEGRFQTYFARDISPYAVTSPPAVSNRRALEAAGFVHVLPWPGQEGFGRARRQGVEAATRQFAASQGMDAAQTDQAVARALDNLTGDGGKAGLDAGMAPHELGHHWFTRAFWPTSQPGEGAANHYAGPGPDWLDELAAVLMEDAGTTERRREQFQRLLRGEAVPPLDPVSGRETLLDLAGFLSRDHPGLTTARNASADVAAGAGVGHVFTQASSGPSQAAQTRVFYLQARGFADFLIEKTGKRTVFSEIAQALAEGRTFESWLAVEGVELGLPGTISGLDDLWREGL